MANENRLTEKHWNGKGYYMLCSGVLRCDGLCGNCDELEKLVDRLGEYEDKAEKTVNTVYVVHGRWETDKEDIEWGNSLKRKHCTNCNKRPHFDKEKREFVLSNFCHHCGAKMDGDTDLRILAEQPDVEAVEVVRCRDCISRVWDYEAKEYWCDNPLGLCAMLKDGDFCSYGERKDNEH